MRNLIFPFVLLALAGCTATVGAGTTPSTAAVGISVGAAPAVAPAPTSDPLTRLHDFTVADLQAASADAKAQVPPDITASRCWDFLAVNLPTIPMPGMNGQTTFGAVMLFQKTRDILNGGRSNSGFLKSMNDACAALVIDAQTTFNKLLLVSAGTAATGGALAPFAGGLGAIGAALPIPLTLP
jgi:hypothetical protein